MSTTQVTSKEAPKLVERLNEMAAKTLIKVTGSGEFGFEKTYSGIMSCALTTYGGRPHILCRFGKDFFGVDVNNGDGTPKILNETVVQYSFSGKCVTLTYSIMKPGNKIAEMTRQIQPTWQR